MVAVDDFSHFEDAAETDLTAADEEQRLEELVEWVRERGRLREETARPVLLTRAGGVSINEIALATNSAPQTIRQAEQRLRRSLSLAR